MPAAVPEVRITAQNAQPISPDGDYVLYWMVASRRTRHSFALDRAVEHCEALGKPLLVLEALRAELLGATRSCDAGEAARGGSAARAGGGDGEGFHGGDPRRAGWHEQGVSA